MVRLPTHKFVTFQLTAEYLSLNWWYFWRSPELARLPTHKFVTFQLTAEYLSLNWWYFWRCPELARLPTHKFVTFQLTAEYLSLNWWYFWRCPELARYQLINCHIDVDWWLLVIELVIFLKVSGFGLITKFQFCHIEVDWWLLYIKLVIFLHTDLIQWQFPVNFNVRYLWTGIIPNFNTVTLSILNFLAANLKVSGVGPITNSQICHISVDCWILVIELVIFLKESGVGPITNSQICNIDVDW